jgi:hypothetical protein
LGCEHSDNGYARMRAIGEGTADFTEAFGILLLLRENSNGEALLLRRVPAEGISFCCSQSSSLLASTALGYTRT